MSDYMERIKEFINGKKVLILGFGSSEYVKGESRDE